MPPKGKGKQKGPNLGELQALADEMNEVMGLDPAIEYDDETDIEDLKLEILNNCFDEDDNCEIYTTDEFSDEALATFNRLNVVPVEPDEEPEPEPEPEPEKGKRGAGGKKPGTAGKKPGKKEPEPEPDPDDEVSVEDDIATVEESDDLEEIKEIAKSNNIRIPPPFLKNLDKLKSYVVEKLELLLDEPEPEPEPEPEKGKRGAAGRRGSAGKKEEDYTPPSSAKKDPRRGGGKKPGASSTSRSSSDKKGAEAKARYTRATAWAEAVAETEGEDISLDDLAVRADEIYCEKTGRGEDASNLRESKWLQEKGVSILVGLNLATVKGNMFTYDC